MLGRSGQEHGFRLRIELAVGQGHLEFVFEIGHGPQSLDNDVGLPAPRVIGQEAVVAVYLHPGNIGCRAADQLHALLLSEQGVFGDIGNHQHDDPVE